MTLNIFSKNFIINLSLIFSIFLIDRFSKIYVIHQDKNFPGSEIYSSEYLNISLIWNQGIAFGLFSFEESKLYNILTTLILIIIFIIIFMIPKSVGFKKLALLMILGGALGNFFDRIIYKAVPDFIDFHIGNFHWFVFNMADIFITMGIISLIILEFTANNKENTL